MVKHNNVRPNIHMHKDYVRWIKTHFDQPMKKKKRAARRRKKMCRKAPRPLRKLRPIVQCCSIRYNMRPRLGRGFTRQELRRAGVGHPKYARTIGISVDLRRKNRSMEHMMRNVRRLKEYLGNLVLFPLVPKGKDAKNKEKMIAYLMAEHKAKLKMAGHENDLKAPMKFKHKKPRVEMVKLDEVPDYNAWGTMKQEWIWKKRHFMYRRNHIRAQYKAKKDAEKAAKKAAKGK